MKKEYGKSSNYKKIKPEEKIIFTKKLALYLRGNGCKIVRTRPNIQKPEFDVWIFENNDRLQKYIKKYMDNIYESKGEKTDD